MLEKIVKTDSNRLTIIIRIMVGMVFLSEGVQKLLYPALRGAGRFEKIGLPNPEFLGTFVGWFEIISGVLIIFGLITRGASAITFVIMIVAMATTKSEVFNTSGFWVMMHGSRTDWSMFLGSIYLMIQGGGNWSVDQFIAQNMYLKTRK